jgi:hypothetical protein
MSEELSPDVKHYEWDDESGVLTGKKEMRKIEKGQETELKSKRLEIEILKENE